MLLKHFHLWGCGPGFVVTAKNTAIKPVLPSCRISVYFPSSIELFFFFLNMVILLRGCLVFQLFCIPRNSSQEIDDPLNRSIMPYMQLIPHSISAVFYTQWALILSLVLIPKP